jgi:hypothetical protein
MVPAAPASVSGLSPVKRLERRLRILIKPPGDLQSNSS